VEGRFMNRGGEEVRVRQTRRAQLYQDKLKAVNSVHVV
jgi:hypothetical protein